MFLIKLKSIIVTSICHVIFHGHKFELGYTAIKGDGILNVVIKGCFITRNYNVMVKCQELIDTTISGAMDEMSPKPILL